MNVRLTRREVLAMMGGGIVVAAVGTGSADAAAATASGSIGPTPARAGTLGALAASGSEFDPTKPFRFQISVGPTRHDPHRAASGFDVMFLFLVFDRLIHLTPDARPAPGLATSWEFNDDGSQLTFNLREGVTFHDGTPFDAAAVKANIERGQTIEGSVVANDLSVVRDVEVVDDATVVFHLDGDAAQLPLVLADRAGAMVSPASFEDPDIDLYPVGTGMYTVADNRPGDTVVYAPYADHWDEGVVKVSQFELTVVADPSTRLNAIRTGSIDLTLIDPSMVPEAEAAGLVVSTERTLGYLRLHMNRSYEPFSKLEVRQALNHAIDRSAIVQGLLGGRGDASAQVFPEGYFAFDEATGTDPYPYDPDRARELLASAGYPDGFSFELLTQTVPRLVQLSEIIQQQLADIGIDVTITQIENASFADTFFVQKKGHASAGLWGGRADPTQTLEALFGSDGFENPGGHTTTEVTERIAATKVAGTDDERAAALQAASAQVVADALDVPIAFEWRPWVLTTSVVGWQQWLTGKPEFRNVAIAAT